MTLFAEAPTPIGAGPKPLVVVVEVLDVVDSADSVLMLDVVDSLLVDEVVDLGVIRVVRHEVKVLVTGPRQQG